MNRKEDNNKINIKIRGYRIPGVVEFCYSGSKITKYKCSKEDIKNKLPPTRRALIQK